MANQVAQLAEPIGGRRSARWLALAGVLAAGLLFLLWWADPQEVALPVCALHRTTGLYCPGCGATRATHELLHGRLLTALRDNALWVLLLPLVLYAAASEIRRVVWGRPLPGNPIASTRLWVAIAVLAVVFAVLRNIPCYPLNLLVPPGG